ncbi:hypothetical protein HMPREF9103_01541 [Lentilactobacillus parafarraginis F0439]|uniref:Uncharacterized protein n=1 Tax=Lentilactobacillus parafarraginis F0439 TaxID=797515 RepID=G9ZP87_9LACO|nr:hypothetical protein HMPREF9103_01541 [Lentilactobacillus parafarraginis F0439]
MKLNDGFVSTHLGKNAELVAFPTYLTVSFSENMVIISLGD